MSKKRIVKEIDFSGEGYHCALVSKAANGESVLLMKNKTTLNEYNINKLKERENQITDLKKDLKLKKENTMVEKVKKEEVDLQKSIDDAVAAALKKEKEKFTELEKSLKEKETELTDLKKAAEEKEKDELTELCKGYSFVEDAEKLSDSLFLCKGIKGFDVILDTLEKARTAIKASLETEVGTDEEADLTKNKEVPENVNKTTELLKARYAKENK